MDKKKAQERTRKWRIAHPGYQRWRKFGLTHEAFLQLLLQQNGCCAICRIQLKNDRHTHVDHDHQTGRVRGILCNRCNAILGFAADDPTRLQLAQEYLISQKAH